MSENSYLTYIKRWRNYAILIGIIVFGICAFLTLLSVPVSAMNNSVSNNTIKWTWDNTGITNGVLDGVVIENFNPNSSMYQKTFDLDTNPTSHTLILYSGVSPVVSSTGITDIKTTGDDIAKIIYSYIYLIGALICAIAGVIIKKTEPFMIAALLAFVGLALNWNDFIHVIIYGLTGMFCFAISFDNV